MFRDVPRRSLIASVVFAGIFAVIAFFPELEAGRMLAFNGLSTTLFVLAMATSLAFTSVSPALALSAAWAGAIVQMAFGRDPSPTDIPVFVALFATAAYGGRRTFWAGFASVFVGAIVIVGYLFAPLVIWSTGPALSDVATAIAVLIAALFGLGLAWTIGALVRTGIRARANRAAQVRAEADAAAEQERVRIARDMHDVVAHSLAVVIAQADGARYAAAADPDAATRALGTISSTARSALSDVRLLLTQLRHSQADGPQPTLADLEALYGQVRAAGVDLRVDVDPAPQGDPPAAVQLAVYRILQEALTNALRHGGPGTVRVGLSWHPDRVELDVRNSLTTRPAAAASGHGHGLVGMGERAALVGGALTAAPDGSDFAVVATLPIRSVA
ncbi:sensor histidine kinase [Microbacterium telephonicum]|uniref:histidine kinase n=1 Tax=Microbacterium telephonicum TaxID=1714841 RepID=A0A498C747_9MICO|nr:histidine kinase [Microbacterium telephonicum]RLK48071.1 signal transduction histidine kinase [Microbacterium telephonicum]